jgi:hypothetical protein
MSYSFKKTLRKSNDPSYLTGQYGNYRNDPVKGISQQTFNKKNNIDENFNDGMIGKTLLSDDKEYETKLLHHNITNEIVRKQDFGFRIFVDSTFRNIDFHPDPFSFKVKFNNYNIENEIISTEFPINEANKYSLTYIDCDTEFKYYKFDGDKQNTDINIEISKQIKNIYSFNLNTVILPRNIHFQTNEDKSITPINKKLTEIYKYIILSIPEIKTDTRYSNTGSIGKDTFILKYDDDFGIDSTYWYPMQETIDFFDSSLQNINGLTFNFRTDKGKPLIPTLDGKPFNFMKEYQRLIEIVKKINQEIKIYKPKEKKDIIISNEKTTLICEIDESYTKAIESLNNVLPKLKSLRNIIDCLYPQVHFTLNTSRIQLDTRTNYNI